MAGRTGDAISAYDRHDLVHEAQTRVQARDDLIDRWDRDRQASPDSSRIILTHTNAEVRELNEAARDRMRAAGDLGEDVRVTVERGERSFAAGDRVMFLQNERGLGVKNGTLGTIEEVRPQSMSVRTDEGLGVSFDLKDYNRIDHGYAATIHKAQGMTVDRTHVLATPGLDAHGSYVALSRHRDGMDLHYGRDDFASQDKLINTLSRDRAKDMATDYEQQIDPAQDYAERRGITFRARVAEIMRKLVPQRLRDAVDGMLDRARQPGDGAPGPEAGAGPEGGAAEKAAEGQAGEDPQEALRSARTRALVRHARAADTIFAAQEQGGAASPEQVQELHDARKVFEDVRPYGSHDAEAAYKKNPELATEAASGRVNRAIRALQLETECAPIRNAARIALWNAGRNSRIPASASMRRATSPVTRPPNPSWATWQRASNAIRNWNPCSPTANANSASRSTQAAALAGNLPSPTASTSAEAGVSGCRTILVAACDEDMQHEVTISERVDAQIY